MTNSEPTNAANAVPRAEPGYVPAFLAEDDDYALGCECANPALQIERWGQEETPPVRQFY
jgi:hypothetical protein